MAKEGSDEGLAPLEEASMKAQLGKVGDEGLVEEGYHEGLTREGSII